MGIVVVNQVIKLMIKKGLRIEGSPVLVMGITFKENCPDIRNSRVIDVVNELKSFGCDVSVYDPWADPEEVKEEYGIEIFTKASELSKNKYNAIVAAVAHDEFLSLDLKALKADKAVVFDIKAVLPLDQIDGRL
jgi:UDP-N-acetyl-D-galactosamine dehydrogenase